MFLTRILPGWALAALLSACGRGDVPPSAFAARPPADVVTPAPEGRLVALGREGQVASLALESPWTVWATADLGRRIASLRCRAGLCAAVHPAPDSALSLFDAATLTLSQRVELPADSDPRDVVFTSDHRVVLSLAGRDHLLEIDLATPTQRRISLAALADGDGLPDTAMLAACGRQVYVQLQRLDRTTGLPSTLPPAIAIVDTWRGDALRSVPLALMPALDMQADCSARTLLVAEPQPIIQGLGRVDLVSLDDGSVTNLLQPDEFANGGMLRLASGLYWLNQHTDFGPGPSSHLFLVGGRTKDVYNVFATEPVDQMVHDPVSGWLFYPNPCGSLGQACDNGVHVFQARTGESAGPSIDPGFPPVGLALSR
jgi:hypothetical protein